VARVGLIALAYLRARLSRAWSRAGIAAGQRRGLHRLGGWSRRAGSLQAMLDGICVSDAGELRRQFATRNRLGISLDEARSLAEAEKAGTFRDRRGFSFGLSSGTDGPPGVFITSPAERACYIGTILGKLLPVRQLAGCRVALLLRHDNRLYSETKRARLVHVEHYDIAVPMAEWAQRLCDDAPDVVIGPPSILLDLTRTAAFARRPLRPRILLAGAEPLFPTDARYLAVAFGIPPRPIYQACEGFVALACPHGTLHVNEDILVAEWQRFRGDLQRAVPVITDFSRTTQDVWRARLADVVTLAQKPCQCGSAYQALAGVEGRLGDILIADGLIGDGHFADRSAVPPKPIFPFELDAAMAGIIAQDCAWQIRQESPQAIAVASGRPLSATERRMAAEALALVGGWTKPSWEALAPRPPEIKRRRFVRNFDAQSQAIKSMLLPPSL